MDEYHAVSLFGSESCKLTSVTDRSTAKKHLQRKIRVKHAKHVLNCLFRAAVTGGLLFVGLQVVGSAWGTALAIMACFLLAHTIWYCIEGHWSISRFRKARMYWLQESRADQDDSPVDLQSQGIR